MAPAFEPKLSILPPAQRRLWLDLAAVPDQFVLYGGTAVALHLGHRKSIDFDFFADCTIDPMALYDSVPFLAGADIIQNEPNTLTCLVDRGDAVKVSFFGVPNVQRIHPPFQCADNGLKIASLLDLAATKVAVVQQRAQAKDYIDIDAIITAGVSLEDALAAAKLVFGKKFMPTPTLKALTYYGDNDLLSLPDKLKKRLVAAASAVDPRRLPSLNRTTAEPKPRGGKSGR